MYKIFSESGFGSNSYLLWDEESKEALLIDCGNHPLEIFDYIRRRELVLKYLLLTHAHYDHIAYLEAYKRAFPDLCVVIHGKDAPLLSDPEANAAYLFGVNASFASPDKTVREGDELTLGGTSYKLLHTPGHTAGSICLYDENARILYTGDTIFAHGRGRTDLATGNEAEIYKSISRILSFGGDVLLMPGHGSPTMVEYERRYY